MGSKLTGGRLGEAPSGAGSLHDIPSPPVWQQVEGDSNHPLGVPANWALTGGAATAPRQRAAKGVSGGFEVKSPGSKRINQEWEEDLG